jgi:hypothetical protein
LFGVLLVLVRIEAATTDELPFTAWTSLNITAWVMLERASGIFRFCPLDAQHAAIVAPLARWAVPQNRVELGTIRVVDG